MEWGYGTADADRVSPPPRRSCLIFIGTAGGYVQDPGSECHILQRLQSSGVSISFRPTNLTCISLLCDGSHRSSSCLHVRSGNGPHLWAENEPVCTKWLTPRQQKHITTDNLQLNITVQLDGILPRTYCKNITTQTKGGDPQQNDTIQHDHK